MNLKNRLIPLLGLGILLATSCQEDVALTGNDGTFTIQSIAANSDVVASRADGQSTVGTEATDPIQPLDPKYYTNGFEMTITANGETPYTWTNYEELFGTPSAKSSQAFDLGSGTYDANVKLGKIDIEGEGQTYFEGKSSFQVFNNANTEVVVTCYLANAKIKAHFTENFKKYFATYTAGITTSLKNELTMTEKSFLYVKPGDVTLKVTAAKRESDKQQTFNIGTKNLEAKHEYTINYDVDAAQQKMIVSFSEDIATEKREIEVSDNVLEARPPVVNLVGFESGTMIEGDQLLNDIQMHINAEAGLKSVKLTTTPLRSINNGWNDELELVNITQDNPNIQYGLIARGFAAGENKLGIVDMSKVLQKMPSGEFTFTLSGTDIYDKAINPVVLKVHKMTFGIEVEFPGDIWAKRAKLLVSSKESPQAVKVERFVGEAWTPIEATYEGGYINLAGLTPNAEYKLRVVDSNDTKNISNVITFKTEDDAQVPNANMEDWYNAIKGGNWPKYYPNKENDAHNWDTMNPYTTSSNSGPRYCSNSGTIPTAGNGGGQAALIKTIGWGDGNTGASGLSAINNITPGELYLGRYTGDPKTRYSGWNKSIRPSAFSFDYKYAPGKRGDQYSADIEILNAANEVIGSASIKDNQRVNTWTTKNLKIVYTNLKDKATSIRIKFKSGENVDKADLVTLPSPNSQSESVGAQLWIDNINLIYE